MKRIILLILIIFFNGVAIAQVSDFNKPVSTKPFVLGEIVEMRSTVLNENRILNIYLPEGYNATDSAKYPVIYLLDGSADEDFIHVVGLVQFNSFEWINLVPKSIVVGIATVDRRRDFTYPTLIKEDKVKYPTTGNSAKFISFIENELQPFIDKTYKTLPDKTIIGQSLGGLLATEILIKKPSLFNKFIIVSPSLWWDNGSLLDNSFLNITKALLNTAVYIGVGKEGITPTKIPRVMEVDANVLADKLQALKNEKMQIYFDYLPRENHATILHQAVLNAFKIIYGKGE